jgi:hypothetical protein
VCDSLFLEAEQILFQTEKKVEEIISAHQSVSFQLVPWLERHERTLEHHWMSPSVVNLHHQTSCKMSRCCSSLFLFSKRKSHYNVSQLISECSHLCRKQTSAVFVVILSSPVSRESIDDERSVVRMNIDSRNRAGKEIFCFVTLIESYNRIPSRLRKKENRNL